MSLTSKAFLLLAKVMMIGHISRYRGFTRWTMRKRGLAKLFNCLNPVFITHMCSSSPVAAT